MFQIVIGVLKPIYLQEQGGTLEDETRTETTELEVLDNHPKHIMQ